MLYKKLTDKSSQKSRPARRASRTGVFLLKSSFIAPVVLILASVFWTGS